MSPAHHFFSGQNLEQAVLKAARHYGVEPDRLAYSVVEKRHGYLRIRRSTLIKVDPAQPERPEGEPARKRRPPSPARGEEPAEAPRERRQEPRRATEPEPAAPVVGAEPVAEEERPRQEAAGELAEAALDSLEHLLDLADLDLEAKVYQGDDRLEVELTGPDVERVVADRGRALIALEHLLPRLIRGLAGRSTACRVDAGGFHGRRRRRLAELARETAAEVRSSGRSRTLPPMAPDERRLVHRALRDEPGVTTESRGQGFIRRVAVLPAEPEL
jgi:spoIIIJ-associated protein